MAPLKSSLALALLLAGAAWSPATALQLVVPAYFYPEENESPWTTLLLWTRNPPIVIVNPDSGPGHRVDPGYTTVVHRCCAAHIRMTGYVHTSYGKIAPATVEEQIDHYRQWYGITDIFIDECASDAAKVGYYKQLTAYVKAQTPGAITILNPGTVPDESYLDAGDILCVFEDSLAAYRTTTFPAWMTRYPPHRFLHIVYNVPRNALAATMRLADKNGAGYFYATDENQMPQDPGSPYDRLPSYYPTEIDLDHLTAEDRK